MATGSVEWDAAGGSVSKGWADLPTVVRGTKLIRLQTIVEPAVLRRLWKGARRSEREIRLTRAPLVRDSSGGVAYDLDLNTTLENLRKSVLEGTYRPRPPLVIEATKSSLLRRRLFFLVPEDDLILDALVSAVRPSLLAMMSSWVNFGREDNPRKKDGTSEIQIGDFDYEGWWIRWLRYMGLLKVVAEDPRRFVLVSDITNFFGSVEIPLLRTRVAAVSSVDSRSIDLLIRSPGPVTASGALRTSCIRRASCRCQRCVSNLGTLLPFGA